MPKLDFKTCTTNPVVLYGKSKEDTTTDIYGTALVLAKSIEVNVTITRAATSLSTDSGTLISENTCRALITDYLIRSNGNWVGNSKLAPKKGVPPNWKGLSQFISLAMVLGVIDSLGPNFRCAFKDFETYFSKDTLKPKWEGNAPDYFISNTKNHTTAASITAVLECKGVTGANLDKTKFNANKLQSLNYESTIAINKSVLAYSLFTAGAKVECNWFNSSTPPSAEEEHHSQEFYSCATGLIQLINQLNYSGEPSIADLFARKLKKEISPRVFIREVKMAIGTKKAEQDRREKSYSNPEQREKDQTIASFFDRETLRRFATAAIYLESKPRVALAILEDASDSVLNNREVYRLYSGFETEIYPTGICFTRARLENDDNNAQPVRGLDNA